MFRSAGRAGHHRTVNYIIAEQRTAVARRFGQWLTIVALPFAVIAIGIVIRTRVREDSGYLVLAVGAGVLAVCSLLVVLAHLYIECAGRRLGLPFVRVLVSWPEIAAFKKEVQDSEAPHAVLEHRTGGVLVFDQHETRLVWPRQVRLPADVVQILSQDVTVLIGCGSRRVGSVELHRGEHRVLCPAYGSTERLRRWSRPSTPFTSE